MNKYLTASIFGPLVPTKGDLSRPPPRAAGTPPRPRRGLWAGASRGFGPRSAGTRLAGSRGDDRADVRGQIDPPPTSHGRSPLSLSRSSHYRGSVGRSAQ